MQVQPKANWVHLLQILNNLKVVKPAIIQESKIKKKLQNLIWVGIYLNVTIHI